METEDASEHTEQRLILAMQSSTGLPATGETDLLNVNMKTVSQNVKHEASASFTRGEMVRRTPVRRGISTTGRASERAFPDRSTAFRVESLHRLWLPGSAGPGCRDSRMAVFHITFRSYALLHSTTDLRQLSRNTYNKAVKQKEEFRKRIY